MAVFAARLPPRLRAVVAREALGPASAAEIWRAVGEEADRARLTRPSYERVRTLVVAVRSPPRAEWRLRLSFTLELALGGPRRRRGRWPRAARDESSRGRRRRLGWMTPCCCPADYRRFFNRKQAHKAAARYRRRGLDRVSRRLVEAAGDVEGEEVLEVGGGIGALEIELLRAGASHAANVELSGGYEDEALELLREHGLERRVDRRLGDFVTLAEAVSPADVVVLNRVVCCYPDYEALLGRAADRTRRRLVFTFPREAWWTRAGIRLVNGLLALRRCGFRSYVHPVAAMLASVEGHGLRVVSPPSGRLWQVAVLDRPSTEAV